MAAAKAANKKGNEVAPTTTATPARLQLYEATQRPKARQNSWITTTWGKCKVSGVLGQRHADLVESVLFCAEKKWDLPDGGAEVMVDPAKIRRCMSDGQYSLSQIRKLFAELRAATIEIMAHDLHCIGGLIDHVVISESRANPLGGERFLWRVRLGLPMVYLLKNDVPIYYNPAPIARLNYGISQALVRHVLSHQTEPRGGWKLNELIVAVAGEQTADELKNRRREIRSDTTIMECTGIVVDGDRVFKSR